MIEQAPAQASDAKSRIVARARAIGFDLVGITDAGPFIDAEAVLTKRRDLGYLE